MLPRSSDFARQFFSTIFRFAGKSKFSASAKDGEGIRLALVE